MADNNINQAVAETDALTKSQTEAAGTSQTLGNVLVSTGLQAAGFADTLKDASGKTRSFHEDLTSITSGFSNLSKVIPYVGNDLSKVFKALGDNPFFQGVAKSVDTTNALSLSFINAAAASGKFNEQLKASSADKDGFNFADVNDSLYQYQSIIGAVASRTGVSRKETDKQAESLSQLSGGLTNVNSLLSINGQNYTALEASIKLAYSTGLSFAEVTSTLSDRLSKVSSSKFQLQTDEESINKALRYVSVLGDLSKTTQIPIKDLRSAMDGISTSFSMMGDVSGSSAKIVADNFDRMREAGLTSAQSISMIQNVTNSISSLNVAQRAFLSSQTGGPGGLRGAFEIQKLIKEDKLDEVYGKLEQSLKKQFGKIVSFEEATKSESAAAQYQKQLTTLRSGPFDGLAKSEGEAERLLDALSKGKGGASNFGGSLNKEFDIGSQISSSLKTTVSQLKNTIENESVLSALDTSKSVRGSMTSSYGDESFKMAQGEIDRKNLDLSLNAQSKTRGDLVSTNRNALVTEGTLIGSAAKDFETKFATEILKPTNETIANLTSKLHDATKAEASALKESIEKLKEEKNEFIKTISSFPNFSELISNKLFKSVDKNEITSATESNISNMTKEKGPSIDQIGEEAQKIQTQASTQKITVEVQQVCTDCGKRHSDGHVKSVYNPTVGG
jgi:hemerythrin-like domain-containing protein